MLSDFRTHATLPVVDMERAKEFYVGKLGFKVETENPAAVFLAAAGDSRFTLFKTPNENRAGHTQMGVSVQNIEQVVADLKSRGVQFEEYDYPTLKTTDSVAETGAGRAAWFKDPEGNMIGLIQFA